MEAIKAITGLALLVCVLGIGLLIGLLIAAGINMVCETEWAYTILGIAGAIAAPGLFVEMANSRQKT